MTEIIDCTWPCMKCGYDLRTLKRDALCPECAFPIAESLKTPPLSMADPAWRRRVWFALIVLAAAVALRMALQEGWISLAWLTIIPIPWIRFSHGGWNSIIQLIWPMSLLPAAMLLRRREHPPSLAPSPGRALLIVVVAHVLFLIAAIIVRLWIWTGWNPAYDVMSDIESVFLIPEVWLIFRTIEELARRIPGKPMLAEARIARYGLTLLLLAYAGSDVVASAISWKIWPTVTGWPNYEPQMLFRISWHLRNAAWQVLRYAWFYPPIFLIRFIIHFRRAVTA